MMNVKLSQYGAVLTGREFGESVMRSLTKELTPPVVLDFDGVESLGSSFGDEVVPPIANKQGNSVKILNANRDVKATLLDIALDAQIELDFVK
jgi:hypothetical protein